MSVEAMRQALEFIGDVYAGEWHGPMSRREQIEQAIRQAISVYESAPPECQTEAEKTAYAFGWWKAMEELKRNKNYD